MRLTIGIIVLLFMGVGCNEATLKASGPVVRDSSGITIVENPDPTAFDTLSWRADTARIVRIGALDGDDANVFGRIGGVARLSDGRIVVADAEAHEIRFFAADGSFLSRTGRRGGGPGEYEFFSGMMRLPGDSLLVIDHEGGRQTVLSPQGAYVRSSRFASRSGETPRSDPPSVRGVFADGTYLVAEYLNACPQIWRQGGLCQDSMRYTRDSPAGDREADFGPQIYHRQDFISLPNGRNYGFPTPFAQAFWSLHGDRFFMADATRFEIRQHGASGRLERIIRLAQQPIPVSDSVRKFRPPPAAQTELERTRNADLAEAHTRRVWPSHLPAFSSFVVDRGGNLWVREYSERNTEASRWLVFDTTGALRYAVRLPPVTIVPYFVFRWRGEIGDDYVLGVVRDEDGVESVWFVPLQKVSS